MMPPFMNTPVVTRHCVVCGASFQTKRPGLAKICSVNRCKVARRTSLRQPPTSERRSELYRAKCAEPGYREKLRAQARERYRRVQEFRNQYKLKRGCIDCGYSAHPAALDFDHMDGKTSNICELTSIAAVLAEIERHGCVVRCANCHRIKSCAVFAATYEPVL